MEYNTSDFKPYQGTQKKKRNTCEGKSTPGLIIYDESHLNPFVPVIIDAITSRLIGRVCF